MAKSGDKINFDEIVSIDKLMSENELILVFRDEINQRATEDLLSVAEVKILADTNQRRLKRKLFNVLIECLQNVVKHADASHIEKYRKSSLFILGKHEEQYFVICGNVIAKKNVKTLTEKIEKINSLSNSELKSFYGKIIAENPYSEKGGAGLGLIEMCRKSGNPIEYNFRDLDDDYAYFTMKLRVG